MLLITITARQMLAQHAERAYPRECVGFLLGYDDGQQRIAHRIFPAHNHAKQGRQRFELDPSDWLTADQAARQHHMTMLGCYHSHPDAHATPSEADRRGAQLAAGPRFSFLIQQVIAGRAALLTSWILTTDTLVFVPEPLHETDVLQ